MAGGQGFEPRLTESESAVLPLDDPPKFLFIRQTAHKQPALQTLYRLENCGRLRALCNPSFLRSTILESLVT